MKNKIKHLDIFVKFGLLSLLTGFAVAAVQVYINAIIFNKDIMIYINTMGEKNLEFILVAGLVVLAVMNILLTMYKIKLEH